MPTGSRGHRCNLKMPAVIPRLFRRVAIAARPIAHERGLPGVPDVYGVILLVDVLRRRRYCANPICASAHGREEKWTPDVYDAGWFNEIARAGGRLPLQSVAGTSLRSRAL